MFLRKFRWIIACVAVVAAVVGSPSQSKADVQILVEELGSNGSVIASQFTSAATPAAGGVVSYSFNNGSFFSGGGSVTVVGSNSSLNPSFSGLLTSAFDASQGHTLRITVTNDLYSVGPGFDGTLLNDSGASSTGLTNGVATVTTSSRIYDPSSGGAVPASSTSQLAGGSTVSGPTANSTVVGAGQGTQTMAPAAALPTPFAIQQTLLISIDAAAPGDVSGTFGATGGARVSASTTPGAVPAPAGLVLALTALPLIGLRRTLRKRAA